MDNNEKLGSSSVSHSFWCHLSSSLATLNRMEFLDADFLRFPVICRANLACWAAAAAFSIAEGSPPSEELPAAAGAAAAGAAAGADIS